MPLAASDYTEGMIGKPGRAAPESHKSSKRVDSRIDAGVFVQLLSNDKDSVEQFDGSGDVLGLARYSKRANLDYQKESVNEDRAYYESGTVAPIIRLGAEYAYIVEFTRAGTEGDFLLVDESNGLAVPYSEPIVAVEDDADVDLNASGDDQVGGVHIQDGDTILLKAQTTSSENGIYTASTATDQTTWTQEVAGDFTPLESGEVADGSIQTSNNNHIGAIRLNAVNQQSY